ncbi:Ldh family oxidoreductase [Burkholderia pyrrocinia]|nr:Ldh family oxidoreductase [Burkholderia pyrrocinia]NTX26735.1 Ldh family oxidoreductase [Burkholderia pyrrocinia]
MAQVKFESLVARLRQILEGAGCSKSVAALIARNCASAERDGAKSHGLFRMPGYVSSLLGNWADGKAEPVVDDVAPGFIRIDAANGYAVSALSAGAKLAMEKARRNGIVVVAIRNSHHLGALSLDVEPFADVGLVALSVLNSMKGVVPHGGKSAVFGTNPMAFAAPRASAPPFVFDQAASTMARGDVSIAMNEGRALPPDVGVDKHGLKTTDPAEIIDGGALLTFGGHKGTTLALMIEILCAALVGSQFSYECDLETMPGAATPCTGQTLILIDPYAGSTGLADFRVRVDELLRAVIDAGLQRVPGEGRLRARERAMQNGINVSSEELDALASLETQVGIR